MYTHRDSAERSKAVVATVALATLTSSPIAAQTCNPILECSWTSSSVQPAALNV
jgi:hypothetical protein